MSAFLPQGLRWPALGAGLFWLALSAVFGLALGSAGWTLAGTVLGGLLMLRLSLAGPWWVAMVWLLLSPLLAVFVDDLLRTLPFIRLRRVLFGLLLLLLLLKALLDKQRAPAFSGLEKRMALFLGVAGLSVVVTGLGKPLDDWLKDDLSLLIDGYLMPMAAFFIARRLPWSAPRRQFFLQGLVALALLLMLTAPLETLLGIGWFIPTTINVIHTLSRATGTFGNAAEYGVVMGSLFAMVTLVYLNLREPLARGACALLLLLIIGAEVLCKTRAPWVGLALTMLTLYALDARTRPVLKATAFVGGLGVLVATPFLLDQWQGFAARVLDPDPIYNRLAGWTTGLNMALQNPITGVGMSRHAFSLAGGEYVVGLGDVSGAWILHLATPHNEFINVAAMTGLLGLATYVAVIVGVFSHLSRTRRDARCPATQRSLCGFVLAVWVGYVVNASFSDFGSLAYINILVYFLAGLALARHADGDDPLPYAPPR